jgi:hypothetical protein
MADGCCTYMPTCALFSGDHAPAPDLAKRYRAHYCVGDWQGCARYAVAQETGIAAVPEGMLPGQHERAYEIVRSRWVGRAVSPAEAVFGKR